MFWLGFSGLPRRVHDYPVIFMGWQGMATTGHLITMVGIIFFFLMILDSHFEKKTAIYASLGLPRWHKRIQYYIFKIRFYQLINKKINRLPNFEIKQSIKNNYFNEFEIYNHIFFKKNAI